MMSRLGAIQWVVVGLVIAQGPLGALHAQETRNSLIERAIFEPDAGQAIQGLSFALHPDSGVADSLWTVGVQVLAELLMQEGEDSLAATWLRWALRIAPELDPDTAAVLAETVDAFRAAARAVAADDSAGGVTTSWSWRAVTSEEADGRLRVTSAVSGGRVVIEGQRLAALDETITLAPGSYPIVVSADGYVGRRVVREVLPGVTTVVDVALAPEPVAREPAIPASTLATLRSRSVRLQPTRWEETSCAAGVVVDSGLILTTYDAIRGANAIALTTAGDTTTTAVRVAVYDVASNIAILRVSLDGSPPAALGPAAGDAAGAWRLEYTDCMPTDTARFVALGAGGERDSADAGDFVAGAPIVGGDDDRVIGVVAADGTPVIVRLDSMLAAARDTAGFSVAEVARRERHAYGAVDLQSDTAGLSARITPLEPWHWPGLARTLTLPARFVGPLGRYRLTMRVGGDDVDESEIVIGPAVTAQLALRPGQPVQRLDGGGGFPIPLMVGILGAAGAAVVMVFGGGDDGTPPPPLGGTGGIIIDFPIP